MVVVVLLGAFSLVQAQESASAQLGEPFEMGFGQEASIESEDIIVKFEEVVQDSRCPSDVVCIWQGQATVSVSVEVGHDEAQELALTLGADASPSAAFGEYSVEMLGLEPYPQSAVSIDPKDYVGTFVVSKVSANSAGVFVRAVGPDQAVITGWNLERGKGTLVLLSRTEEGVQRSVARFTPAAVPCTVPDARECIDGQVMEARDMIGQGVTIHLEVQGSKLYTTSDGAHWLDIKKIRTIP